jgi:hypothetical protein
LSPDILDVLREYPRPLRKHSRQDAETQLRRPGARHRTGAIPSGILLGFRQRVADPAEVGASMTFCFPTGATVTAIRLG